MRICGDFYVQVFLGLRPRLNIKRAVGPCQTTATATAKAKTIASSAICVHPTHRDVAAMDGAPDFC